MGDRDLVLRGRGDLRLFANDYYATVLCRGGAGTEPG